MKLSTLMVTPFFIGILPFTTSCKQWQETIKPAQKYQISQIRYASIPSSPEETIYGKTFYFNSDGEPLKAVASNLQTGNSNQAYTYDNKGRLISLVLFFGEEASPLNAPPQYNNTFVGHTYAHNTQGNIVADTFFITDGEPVGLGGFVMSITNYTYDSYSRMTRSVEKDRYGHTTDTKYVYDANGNLNGYAYDDHLSIHRLSKVMMFLNRDYSLNNRLTSITDSREVYAYNYNSNKLPVQVVGFPLIPSEFGTYLGTSTISYVSR